MRVRSASGAAIGLLGIFVGVPSAKAIDFENSRLARLTACVNSAIQENIATKRGEYLISNAPEILCDSFTTN